MGGRAWRCGLLGLLALGGCGGGAGGGGDADAGATAQPLVVRAPVDRGTLLQAGWSAYPRLVRLAHQGDAAANGRIVASVTELGDAGLQAGLHVSRDDGASFARLGTLRDPDFAGGLCCGTLFELPAAVGTLPAGTLLYAASVGADTPGGTVENRIYRSDDGGHTFARLEGALCGRSQRPRRSDGSGGPGVWEPEFFVAGDGALACVWSDESQPGRSQALMLTRTVDGVAWSAPRVAVTGPAASDRPGMATVRRTADGRYAMSFEHCSSDRLDCAARLLWSADGTDWGAPGSVGVRAQTADGRFFRHAPTLAPQPDGTLLLIGQLLAAEDRAADLSPSGRTVMAGDGTQWRLAAAPIGLPSPPATTNFCQNYSTPLLPSADGTQLLMMQTDFDADGTCRARFGRAALRP